VKCAFCGGTGNDPFQLLSRLSKCPVCKGHRTLPMNAPTVPCAYCLGTGRQRHTRLACSGCGGAGLHVLAGPAAECPQCDGSGRESEADLPCSRCGGAGLVVRAAPREQRRRKRQEISPEA
jgi:DnaJ-class molecular chaperone